MLKHDEHDIEVVDFLDEFRAAAVSMPISGPTMATLPHWAERFPLDY